MNLKLIRLRVARLISDILGFFDGGLDSAIAAFTAADRKLEALRAKVDQQLAREQDLVKASYEYVNSITNAERDRRKASFRRQDALLTSRTRATAIQARIGELLK